METAAGSGRIIRREEDRLSKLGDGVLGHVLSFLPAKEAARAAALSTRWRDVYAGVHAVSLEQPESPIPDYDDDDYCRCSSPGCTYGQRVDPNAAPPFATAVTAALVARHRGRDPPPLTALRVALNRYCYEDASTVDHWISYAMKQAAAAAPAGLELDLRLRREDLCSRAYSLRAGGAASLKEEEDNDVEGKRVAGVSPRPRSLSPDGRISDDVGEEEQPTRSRRRALSRSVSGGAADPVLDSDDEDVARRRAKIRRRSSTSRSPSSRAYSLRAGGAASLKEEEEDIDNDVEGKRVAGVSPRPRSLSPDGRISDDVGEEEEPTRSRRRRRALSRSVSGVAADPVLDSDEEDVARRRAKIQRRSSTSRSPSRSQSSSRSEYSTAEAPRRRDWGSSSDEDDRRQRSPSRSPDHREERARRPLSLSPPRLNHPDDDIVSSDDEKHPPASPSPVAWSRQAYNAPSMLFSCAVLRSLRIGPCRLSPPVAVSLPSLEELLLTRVSDDGEDVQRLISACPRLADLTLEACDTVTALSLLDCGRLRRLALRCCHKLATVAVDASRELHTLEYRGAVPDQPFLTMHGGGGGSITSCKVDICGEEFSSVEELTKLRDFLQLLAPSTTHLHLHTARLGSSIDHDTMTTFPAFPHLRHLELRGRLPHDAAATATAAVDAVRRILQHAPSLEVLTLLFETGTDEVSPRLSWHNYKEGELHDAHHLRYDEHDDVLALPAAAVQPPPLIPCLRNGRVREINLVHYHGGRTQRTLAKFLLRNAPLLEQLYCGFARGPLWIQTKLRDEINDWAMNKPGNRIFS